MSRPADGAVARGAAVIEKHVTLDRTAKGPDHSYTLEPAELKRLVAEIREAHDALGAPVKEMLPEERRVERPALGLRARYRDAVTGARAARAIKADAPIAWEDLAW